MTLTRKTFESRPVGRVKKSGGGRNVRKVHSRKGTGMSRVRRQQPSSKGLPGPDAGAGPKPRMRTGATPEFCDYECAHAAFSAPDASGACRRDQAVWCTLLSHYNNKNARCLAAAQNA